MFIIVPISRLVFNLHRISTVFRHHGYLTHIVTTGYVFNLFYAGFRHLQGKVVRKKENDLPDLFFISSLLARSFLSGQEGLIRGLFKNGVKKFSTRT